jgi:Ca2+/Na+ antiporter
MVAEASAPSEAVRSVVERFPAALVIAGGTAVGYWLAHVYEAAYLDYFGLPASLVRVSTNTTIVAAGAALSVAWFALGFAIVASSLFRNWRFDGDLFVYLTAGFFRFFAALLISVSDWKTWGLELGTVTFLIVMVFLFRRWKKNRETKQQPEGAKEASPQIQTALPEPPPPVPMPVAAPAVARALMPWIGREGLVIVYCLFLARGVARDAGAAAAREGSDFLTFTRGASSYVVLRTYDDVLVAAPVDRRRLAVKNELLLLPIAKQEQIALRWEALGSLHREQQSAGTSPQGSDAATLEPRAAVRNVVEYRDGASRCLPCHPG